MKVKPGKYVIAIDGPAGSGKSTTAKILAKKLYFFYLDTGAMYRALTWKAIRLDLDVANSQLMQKLALNIKIDFKNYQGKSRIYLDGKDLTDKINSSEVDRLVSVLSKHKAVRKIMVKKQREFAKNRSIVIEGRDITTVVFPKADLKIFLKADLNIRAGRKFRQLKQKTNTTLKEQTRLIRLRDKLDRSRKASPLRISPDAIIIDTTDLGISEQVNRILKIFKETFAV